MSTSVFTASHVTKSYPSQSDHSLKGLHIEILKDVDFTLSVGETVAIVGSSGSGKSTLLSLLAGLDNVSTGRICYGDTDIGLLSEDQLARFRAHHLGLIFQRFHLMPHLTALENVALPIDLLNLPAAKDTAQKTLAQVNLSERANHFPSQLSGGECQRVAIARAMVTNPSLILADEPTGNLDDEHAQRVSDILFGLVRESKMAMILVTHNLSLATRCERVLRLKNGMLNPIEKWG